jgi:hypothetical protein
MRSLDTVEQWTQSHFDRGHTISNEPDFLTDNGVGRKLSCSCGSTWGDVVGKDDEIRESDLEEPKAEQNLPNGWDNRSGSGQSHPYATPPTEVPPDDATLTAIIDDLRTWWYTTAENDFAEMEPKIGEYTASDLVLMGQFLEHWLALPAGSGPEAACAFYALGKIARSVSAYREGRLPSTDTLHDLCVYGMMMRRIRENGQWP